MKKDKRCKMHDSGCMINNFLDMYRVSCIMHHVMEDKWQS